MANIINKDYLSFLNDIKARITTSRIQAVRSVNRELILLYWEIGRTIVQRQKKHGWGKSVVERLSLDLTREYETFGGFSKDNLWRMRMFYLEYHKDEKLAQLVPEIPWGHNVLLDIYHLW